MGPFWKECNTVAQRSEKGPHKKRKAQIAEIHRDFAEIHTVDSKKCSLFRIPVWKAFKRDSQLKAKEQKLLEENTSWNLPWGLPRDESYLEHALLQSGLEQTSAE